MLSFCSFPLFVLLWSAALLAVSAAEGEAAPRPLPSPCLSQDFPSHWGEVPNPQTADYRVLPGGYGFGSGTLICWISGNMLEDRETGRTFPPCWGPEPLAQTRDYRPLPLGYGFGSGTLETWILDQAIAAGVDIEEYDTTFPEGLPSAEACPP